MPECVGSYPIRTANVNVEGADTLAGAILAYNRPPLVLLIIV